MAEKNITRKYVFTVEGDTEKLYFDWLMDTINNSGRAFCNVSIASKVEKNPLKYAKGINKQVTPSVSHICDIESNEPCHQERLHDILSQMKDAKTQRGIKYSLVPLTECSTDEVIIDDSCTETPDYAVRRLAEFFLKKMQEEDSAHLQDMK